MVVAELDPKSTILLPAMKRQKKERGVTVTGLLSTMTGVLILLHFILPTAL